MKACRAIRHLLLLPALFIGALGQAPPVAAVDLPAYIGMAEMSADGTIVLRLRAEGPNGIVGHSILAYPPDHPQYREIIDHVGPLKPGETVSVKPWPETSTKGR